MKPAPDRCGADPQQTSGPAQAVALQDHKLHNLTVALLDRRQPGLRHCPWQQRVCLVVHGCDPLTALRVKPIEPL
nr:hypothetical protein [Synechococcus sp. CB0205]